MSDPAQDRCLDRLEAAGAAAEEAWNSGVDSDAFIATYTELVDCWRALDDGESREQIAELCEGQGGRGLLWFADQAAVLAQRRDERVWIERGVLAIVLEGGRYEPRESLRELGLLDHTAGRIGLRLADVVDDLRGYATGDVTAAGLEVVDRYLQAPLTLDQLGLVEVDGDDGVEYRPADG